MGNNVKASFSERESEIADLLARGLSEKEIAEKLFISPATVNNHTRNIREKFGLSKNSEIILLYIATRNKKPFNLRTIKELGVSAILIMLNVCDISRGF
jgi:DNA-binding CsgD family transcriptional regulator